MSPDAGRTVDADRLLFLDGLRALAALWVLFGHIYLFAIGWQAQTAWAALPLNLLMYMHLGVDAFLVLSGYCLALPVVRNGDRIGAGLPSFFVARALRILPPYLATLFLILLVNCFVPLAAWGRNDLGLTATISSQVWWSNLLLLQDLYGQYNTINGPFWSIACEWHLYFVFPLLIWLLRRFGLGALMALSLAAAWGLTELSSRFPRLPLDASVPQPPFFIALFAMGIAAAALAHGAAFAALRARCRRGAWLIAALLLALLGGVLHHYRIVDVAGAIRFGQHYPLIDPLAGAFTAALLVVLSGLAPGRRPRAVLERRWLVGIGGFSYSLYLIHVPIVAAVYTGLQQLPAYAGLGALRQFAALALLAAPACIASAYAFARVFERRIRWRPASMVARRA
ncbi:acyltransferase family protein [Duganella aceris]|uniref:Acyltransferase n=1 Tax=Duganella aceris TaxID=2703883 RepID=A0ABX0FPX9_9BURK|nr:acyltransferase [Duganella aceris]NGZ86551.1 acyltransferase [Duganella aceris]